jgi:hypothetical protein
MHLLVQKLEYFNIFPIIKKVVDHLIPLLQGQVCLQGLFVKQIGYQGGEVGGRKHKTQSNVGSEEEGSDFKCAYVHNNCLSICAHVASPNSSWLVKLMNHIVSFDRLIYELELAHLAREPEQKKTIYILIIINF